MRRGRTVRSIDFMSSMENGKRGDKEEIVEKLHCGCFVVLLENWSILSTQRVRLPWMQCFWMSAIMGAMVVFLPKFILGGNWGFY